MLYGLVLVLHILVCLFLIVVILVQGGRGGMGETLAGASSQSLFGGAANAFMSRITAVAGGLFMVACLSLAMLSTARGRSVVEQFPIELPQAPPEASGPQPPASSPEPEPSSSAPAEAPPAPASPESPPSPSGS
jgi:preprotein translocase subunit SecG